MSWRKGYRIKELCRDIRELPRASEFVPFIIEIIVIVIGTLPYLKFLVMSDVVSGLFIGTGVTLIATGLSETRFFTSTTELEGPVLDLEVFDNVYRVLALLHNPGSVIVKDTKAVMELEGLDSKLLSSILVKDCAECPVGCSTGTYLVNRVNPVIKGEPLPWAIPERPIERPAFMHMIVIFPLVIRTDYVHITSISPH